jgi:RNA polymerase sigma-70 factor (ECF subfamily)
MLTIQKSITEDQLIAGCRKGDPKAQKMLYERLAPKMLGVCFRYVQDREEAEHVMIGGMVKVFHKIDQYKGEGVFEGWIRRIMVNESLMYLRKHQSMSLEVDIEHADRAPDLDTIGQLLEIEDLMRMIKQLPIGYRTVFNLYAIEGYNHAEIGKMLGINENTSKSQLSRARKLLQNKLNTLEQNEQVKTLSHGSI